MKYSFSKFVILINIFIFLIIGCVAQISYASTILPASYQLLAQATGASGSSSSGGKDFGGKVVGVIECTCKMPPPDGALPGSKIIYITPMAGGLLLDPKTPNAKDAVKGKNVLGKYNPAEKKLCYIQKSSSSQSSSGQSSSSDCEKLPPPQGKITEIRGEQSSQSQSSGGSGDQSGSGSGSGDSSGSGSESGSGSGDSSGSIEDPLKQIEDKISELGSGAGGGSSSGGGSSGSGSDQSGTGSGADSNDSTGNFSDLSNPYYQDNQNNQLLPVSDLPETNLSNAETPQDLNNSSGTNSSNDQLETSKITPFEKNLYPGSEGEGVKNLQNFLNENGANLKVDGIYGQATAQAVKDYQAANPQILKNAGIENPTGNWGQASRDYANNEIKSLNDLQSSSNQSKFQDVSPFTNNLSTGSTGSDVKNLQHYLNENGANIKEDGVYGSATAQAVKDYQVANPQILKNAGINSPTGNWGTNSREYANNTLNSGNSSATPSSGGTSSGSTNGIKIASVPLAGESNQTLNNWQSEKGLTQTTQPNYAIQNYNGKNYVSANVASLGGKNDPYVSATETGTVNGVLLKNLPDNHPYIAGIWDYSQTPRSELVNATFEAVNPATGATVKGLKAADWANPTKGRGWEVSSGVMASLGATTNTKILIRRTN
ncbi:MAG: peptidoglycan-binding protein [Candidatus Paceibacterota bacterium]